MSSFRSRGFGGGLAMLDSGISWLMPTRTWVRREEEKYVYMCV
jgi:hypothetical protein